ncbi:helicase HerA domain-containing protein [Glycomyces artemisiae]|uniref:Uncharacterized protein DUF87 n=1 Tax=Glycomyces artemisiae TaxID=1076443 RepID=A0A2T0U831_9ACTN|nr:DUF87 domain-containing protein [Glycomyces artemisiae]PRY54059.1 uncharacterized protein DUF87 [Glycomyces artemisiae]
MSDALEALRRAPSDFAVTPEDIWDEHSRPHVKGINQTAMSAVEAQIDLAERSRRSSVYGLPVLGEGGHGKSHLLGQTRINVQMRGGFFVRLSILHLDQFWPNLVGSYREALTMPHRAARTGLAHLLETLAAKASVPDKVRRQVLGDRRPDAESASRFIEAVRELDPALGSARWTLKALVYLHSRDEFVSSAADEFLNGGEADVFHELGLSAANRTSPKGTVRDLSRLMSICGATVVAVDQVDDIVRASSNRTDQKRRVSAGALLDMLGVNLVDVRDETRRTTVLVACLRNTWREFASHTTATIAQRFEPPVYLDGAVPSPEVAADLLAAVLAPVYRETGFTPPYPSYPFPLKALDQAMNYSPRQLLRTASLHIHACVSAGAVTELERLDTVVQPATEDRTRAETEPLADLDAKYEQYRDEAVREEGASPEEEFRNLRPLLVAGLRAYRIEARRDRDAFEVSPSAGESQSYHVEVRDRSGERPKRLVFRAIATDNATSVFYRLRSFCNWAKLGEDDPIESHQGILWVTAPRDKWRKWSSSAKAWQWIEKVQRDGLEILASDEDYNAFAALARMESERVPHLDEWLRLRRPASRTNLMQALFGRPPETPAQQAPPIPVQPTGETRPDVKRTETVDHRVYIDVPLTSATAIANGGNAKGGSINVGALGDGATSNVGAIGEEGRGQLRISRSANGTPAPAPKAPVIGRSPELRPVYADLWAMPKHIGVFAGSGSGKTVLLRRIIETAALQGVSSIVLDPNNDLSRLGDRWPHAPSSWLDGDEAWAGEYGRTVEVLVWTPGRNRGRPLSFQPLPDFSAVVADDDEFEIAVDTAVASLVPRARIGKSTPRDDHARAVLRQALAAYARDGSSDFAGFLAYLEELPEGASSIGKAADIAAQIASTLRAAVVNDRVFAGAGRPLDPGVLLTPSKGKRARISVVNFMGLPTEEQRQGFVNQLELALFSWAKRNPADNGVPLSGLLVLDEAQTLAPSIGSTICLDSTLALVSQARKYGLGMLFATQSPKGIHNRIVGNCATHWYGRINAPSQIAAATEVAQSKGGSPVDLAHLAAGQFYLAADGSPTERVDVPMCLSHHPSTAPTAEEILAAVRRSGEEAGE